MKFPFLRPNPPKLSGHVDRLKVIEESGWFSNYGPVCREFESTVIKELFDGHGYCTSVNNATTGLLITIKYLTDVCTSTSSKKSSKKRFALMPSFTFAATAHAAIWNGLTPLFCDIDPLTWLPDIESEYNLLRRYSNEIAVIVPYATFGNCVDNGHYEDIFDHYGTPIVIDAAASLGCKNSAGNQFGLECGFPVVFSMHATKSFATSEGGLIYSTDEKLIDIVRAMGNFGFNEPRSAHYPGLNSKLPEVNALLCLEKLKTFGAVVESRQRSCEFYEKYLKGVRFQDFSHNKRPTYQFFPSVIPGATEVTRNAIVSNCSVNRHNWFFPRLAG